MEVAGNAFIYVHIIFSTALQKAVLTPIVRKVLFPFIKQSARAKGVQVVAVSGVENHIHCLIKVLPFQSLQQVVSTIKGESEDWLNATKLTTDDFNWDNGFAAYSVSPSTIDKSVEYLNKQEEYHKNKSFAEEMNAFNNMVVSIAEQL